MKLWRSIVTGLPVAIESTVAMLVAVIATAVVDPEPGLMVLAGVLAIALSRSHLLDSWRGRLEALLALPVVGLATAAVGLLLLHFPVVGALAFTAGMFLSVWLRRFGPAWRRIGALVSLPFVTLLIAPTAGLGGAGPIGAALVSIGVVLVVVLVRLASRNHPVETSEASPSESTLRPSASTRMAIQFAAAIAAAFAVGFWLFPDHVTWVVLSAFLVSSGNRGRADVLLKSGNRLLGAAVGTLAAIPLIALPSLEGAPLVAVALVIVTIGLVLRNASYAFWALTVTLVIALLQSGSGSFAVGERLLAILVGALLGVLASWFLLPIRSEAVLRRRIGEVLARLDDSLATDAPPPSLARVNEVAPPFLALARVPRAPLRWTRAATWITLTRDAVDAVSEPGVNRAARAELGAAWRALKDPAALSDALGALLVALRRD